MFRNDRVVAVLDFDAARRSRRVIDVGNGVLQFSMMAGGDPATWPPSFDEARAAAFLSGYASLESISDEELRAIPHLMAEALVAECTFPITQTGSVGRWPGFRMLKMVRRKLAWLDEHQADFHRVLVDAARAGDPPAAS